MPATSDGGKADGVRLLSPFEVPSHYVDFTKRYLSSRGIDSLMQVGALDPAAQAIITQSEGIFPNHPANGRLDAFELYRVEQTDVDADPAALQRLWKLLEVADEKPMKAPGLRDTAVVERMTPPKLVWPALIAISSLPAALQSTARIIEQHQDYDHDPATIHTFDIDLASGHAYLTGLDSDVALLRREWHARATSTGEAAVLVPMPGTGTSVGTLGGISFQTTYDIKLREQRTFGPNEWTGKLEMLTDIDVRLATASGDTLLFLALDDAREILLPGPTASLPPGMGGAFIVERFHAGERAESHQLLVPTTGPARVADLSRYLDFTIYGDDVALAKNVASTAQANGVYHVDFDYSTTAIPVLGADQVAVDAVATPTNVAAGRYRLFVTLSDGITTELHPTGYPHGVFRHYSDTARFAMHDGHKSLSVPAGTATIEIVPATRELIYIESSGRHGSLVVEPWMRTYD